VGWEVEEVERESEEGSGACYLCGSMIVLFFVLGAWGSVG
jgi:hypothetical protein